MADTSSSAADQERTFLQPGRTYASGGPYTAPEMRLLFRVERVTRHPDRGQLRAFGWLRAGAPGESWHGSFLDEDQVDGWMLQPDENGDQEPGSPTSLRWGLDDAEVGDDDSVTLLLSGPAGKPYVLELEPERVAALRDLLADTGGCECEPMQLAPDEYMHHPACPTRQGETGGDGRG